jgi:hypothetical protein
VPRRASCTRRGGQHGTGPRRRRQAAARLLHTEGGTRLDGSEEKTACRGAPPAHGGGDKTGRVRGEDGVAAARLLHTEGGTRRDGSEEKTAWPRRAAGRGRQPRCRVEASICRQRNQYVFFFFLLQGFLKKKEAGISVLTSRLAWRFLRM